MLKQTPVPGVDLSNYTATRQWAPSHDGTLVPVDLVHRVDTPIDGTAPCLVYGYGSYEASEPPWFSPARLSLLDRGFVWALAHPRGGGELGRRWYLDGKLLNKRNTFLDTIAVAEHVVANLWAHRDRVAIRGGSAGGLLVGACMTMRPELFAAVVAEVPFVDVVTTMYDTSLPLTITEWDEWGNPASEPLAGYMLSYSPYDQTTARDYPAVFITAGLNDVRVSYHEPAKWIAKLRAVRTNAEPLLMRCEMGGRSRRAERSLRRLARGSPDVDVPLRRRLTAPSPITTRLPPRRPRRSTPRCGRRFPTDRFRRQGPETGARWTATLHQADDEQDRERQ
jgi:oligopeptidase B